jgi:Transglutaminase-like superfamily
MRRLRNFLKLRTRARVLLLVTFILLASVKCGLKLVPFYRLFKFLASVSTFKVVHRANIAEIVWSTNIVTNYMPGGAKCLARALTTQVLMNWHGYKPEFRIGVAKADAGNLEAHAWIEYQGFVIIGNLDDLGRFIPLPSLEGVRI